MCQVRVLGAERPANSAFGGFVFPVFVDTISQVTHYPQNRYFAGL